MKPFQALLASAVAGAAALGAATGFAAALRHEAAAHSHELPPYAAPVATAHLAPGVLEARGKKLYFGNCAHCHGFYGASSMERLPTERALTEQTRKFKAVAFG